MRVMLLGWVGLLLSGTIWPVSEFSPPRETSLENVVPKELDPLNLVYFGFASCPDICPLTLRYLKKETRELETKVFFLSLDPERDKKLAPKVVEGLGEHFRSVVLPEAKVKKLAKEFMLYFKKRSIPKSQLGYTIDHPDDIYVVNDQGDLLALYRGPHQEGVLRTYLQDRPQVVVQDPWIRATEAETTALYLKLEAKKTARTLLRAEVTVQGKPIAKAVELHQTERTAEGTMQMSPISELQLKADKWTELKPRGTHIMLIGLNKSFYDHKGTFELSLFFKGKKTPLKVQVPKRSK